MGDKKKKQQKKKEGEEEDNSTAQILPFYNKKVNLYGIKNPSKAFRELATDYEEYVDKVPIF
jgi:hypothetical protein